MEDIKNYGYTLFRTIPCMYKNNGFFLRRRVACPKIMDFFCAAGLHVQK